MWLESAAVTVVAPRACSHLTTGALPTPAVPPPAAILTLYIAFAFIHSVFLAPFIIARNLGNSRRASALNLGCVSASSPCAALSVSLCGADMNRCGPPPWIRHPTFSHITFPVSDETLPRSRRPPAALPSLRTQRGRSARAAPRCQPQNIQGRWPCRRPFGCPLETLVPQSSFYRVSISKTGDSGRASASAGHGA